MCSFPTRSGCREKSILITHVYLKPSLVHLRALCRKCSRTSPVHISICLWPRFDHICTLLSRYSARERKTLQRLWLEGRKRRKEERIKVKENYSRAGRGGILSNTDFCSGIISSFSGTGSRLGGAGSVTGGKSSIGNSVITLNPVPSNEDGDDEIELIVVVVADASSTDKSAATLSGGRVAAALLLAFGGCPVTSCISNLQSHFQQLLPHKLLPKRRREKLTWLRYDSNKADGSVERNNNFGHSAKLKWWTVAGFRRLLHHLGFHFTKANKTWRQRSSHSLLWLCGEWRGRTPCALRGNREAALVLSCLEPLGKGLPRGAM